MASTTSAPRTQLHHPAGLLDVLRVPVLGRMLRWRYGRLVLQTPFFIIALLLIYDGFTGPDQAYRNLATVAPWIHYRGIIVIVVLLLGNLFCMGCPFTIPRTLGKRLSLRKQRFPRALRNKWVALGSLMALFFLYEWLDLWSSPALTAWVIVAYFIASFALEAAFGESAFCKYVCPLGTFNFVYSTTGPTQIGARDPEVCRTCVGKECVNGNYAPEPVIRIDQIATADGGTMDKRVEHGPQGTPGCGLELFVPQIKTNLDCTMCLDCARACPHDNVGLMVRSPGRELFRADAWPRRWDVAFLVICLAALGLVNAFGMIPPVYDLMQNIAEGLGLVKAGLTDSAIEAIVLALIFITGGLLIPVGVTLGVAWSSRALTESGPKYSLREIVTAFAPAFVPIGLGIWFAHYTFHFLDGALMIVPVLQTFLADHGLTFLGGPDWTLRGIRNTDVIGAVQAVVLGGGFLWSMLLANRTSLRLYRRQAMPGFLPWAIVLVAMAAMAAEIFFNNTMEQRGTISFAMELGQSLVG